MAAPVAGTVQGGGPGCDVRASLERSCALFDAAGDLVGSCAARGWRFQFARSAAELEELLDQIQEQLERHAPVKDPQVEARIIRTFSADYRLPARHPLWTFGIERADGLARRLPEPGQRLRMAGFAGLAHSYLGDITRLRSVIAAARRTSQAPGVSVRDRYVFLTVRSLEAFVSGSFEAAEAMTATLEAEVNTSPLDQMGHDADAAARQPGVGLRMR